MEGGFIVGLVLLIGLMIYYRIKAQKRKKEIEKIKAMNIEEKKIYIMKMQLKSDNLKTNHVLHLLLCIPTAGLWIIAWFFIAQSNQSQRSELEKLLNEV